MKSYHSLPNEIRHMIWVATIPPQTPQVHFLTTDSFGFLAKPQEPTAPMCSEKPCPRSRFDPKVWPQVREPSPAGLQVCRQSRRIILQFYKRTKKNLNRGKGQQQQPQKQEEEEQEYQNQHLPTLRPFIPDMDILFLDMDAAPARYSRKVWMDEPRTHLFQVSHGQPHSYLSEVTKLALPFGAFSPEYLHMQHIVSWILTLLPIRELHVVFGRRIWSDQEYEGWHDSEEEGEDDDCNDISLVSSSISLPMSLPISPPISSPPSSPISPSSTSSPISPLPSPAVSWRIFPPKTRQLNRVLNAAKMKSWMAGCWPQGHVGAPFKSEGVLGILSNGIVVKPGVLVRSTGWE
ncbi:hypothetical protein PspLS_11000 [Pyricularia sp. CBS 133598]|nr:hypothetical protein PspLS_11000 [Pyricularia sp. CBS 133598]